VFTHTPGKYDDCIDLMLREKPDKVTLKLTVREFFSDFGIIVQFRSEYTWSFNGQEVKYEEVCGGFMLHEPEKHKCLALYKANGRLERKLQLLHYLSVEIVGSDNRFVYSIPLVG
jgi:hypothetical protein